MRRGSYKLHNWGLGIGGPPFELPYLEEEILEYPLAKRQEKVDSGTEEVGKSPSSVRQSGSNLQVASVPLPRSNRVHELTQKWIVSTIGGLSNRHWLRRLARGSRTGIWCYRPPCVRWGQQECALLSQNLRFDRWRYPSEHHTAESPDFLALRGLTGTPFS